MLIWGREGAHLGGGCLVRRGREDAHLRGGKRALIKAWALSQGSKVYSFSTQA